MLNDRQLDRYSRQILVPGIDLEGQTRIGRAHVVIVGCGGLGCPLALYLAGAGVGHLTLFDDDRVEVSNLQRQIGYSEGDIGTAKAEALATRIRDMNTDVEVTVNVARFDHAAQAAVNTADLVIDASDSRRSRLAIEDVTRALHKPWIMGAAVQMSAQWIAFGPEREGGCYHCLSPLAVEDEAGGCARLGVLGPVVGATAMMQATQALLWLSGNAIPWARLTLYDFRRGEQQSLSLSPDANCESCTLS